MDMRNKINNVTIKQNKSATSEISARICKKSSFTVRKLGARLVGWFLLMRQVRKRAIGNNVKHAIALFLTEARFLIVCRVCNHGQESLRHFSIENSASGIMDGRHSDRRNF